MSKCQKNKYFNVGSQPCKPGNQNPEFQSQISRLLAERERQDFALAAPPAATASQSKTQIVLVACTPSKKPSRMIDIDTILNGDA
jgi:hypothetical protein